MDKNKYKIKVNEDLDFEFSSEQIKDFDFVKEQNGTFHALKNNKAYRAEIIEANHAKKAFTVNVNGNPYQIKIEDHYDQLVNKLGLAVVNTQVASDVKAPMPGLVLDVSVEVGQEVKEGEGLLILEAMKMENVLKAVGDGQIKAIHTEQGKAVEKGQLLIEME